jgi:hypothetical protein
LKHEVNFFGDLNKQRTSASNANLAPKTQPEGFTKPKIWPIILRMKWQTTYLAALAGGTLDAGARKLAGVSMAIVNQERAVNPLFAEEEEVIREAITDSLEEEAIRRARDGIDKPIYHQGVQVDTVKEYSDSLLQFLLKGRRRQTYGDKLDHSGTPQIQIALRDLAAEAGLVTVEQAAEAIVDSTPLSLRDDARASIANVLKGSADPLETLQTEAGRRLAARSRFDTTEQREVDGEAGRRIAATQGNTGGTGDEAYLVVRERPLIGDDDD